MKTLVAVLSACLLALAVPAGVDAASRGQARAPEPLEEEIGLPPIEMPTAQSRQASSPRPPAERAESPSQPPAETRSFQRDQLPSPPSPPPAAAVRPPQTQEPVRAPAPVPTAERQEIQAPAPLPSGERQEAQTDAAPRPRAEQPPAAPPEPEKSQAMRPLAPQKLEERPLPPSGEDRPSARPSARPAPKEQSPVDSLSAEELTAGGFAQKTPPASGSSEIRAPAAQPSPRPAAREEERRPPSAAESPSSARQMEELAPLEEVPARGRREQADEPPPPPPPTSAGSYVQRPNAFTPPPQATAGASTPPTPSGNFGSSSGSVREKGRDADRVREHELTRRGDDSRDRDRYRRGDDSRDRDRYRREERSASTETERPRKGSMPPPYVGRRIPGEEQAYQACLQTTLAGRPAEGIAMFEEFQQAFPDGRYAPNAEYWIGENLYAQGKYREALERFRNVWDHFPSHHKSADALLKAGMCLNKLGDKEGARHAYGMVLRYFPNSEAAGKLGHVK